MNNDVLTSLGLTEDEANIYKILLDGGFMPARTIAIKANLGRPLTYKILDDLIVRGVVEKKEVSNKIALFSPVHPRELEKLLETKRVEIENTKKALDESLGQMISKYNLFIGKPNVQFYEGIEGAIKVTSDLPTEDKEILSYIDSEKVIKLFPKQNEEHIKNRERMGIIKKIIIPDNDFTKNRAKSYNKNLTSVKVMNGVNSFPSAIQIYDNKISFLTLSEQKMVGVIIEDKEISEMMKKVFNSNWDKLNSTE